MKSHFAPKHRFQRSGVKNPFFRPRLMSHPAAPVADLVDAIAAAAREVNDGTFCCGGKLPLNAPIKLACYDATAAGKHEAVVMTVPAAEHEIPDLLALCQEASFGRGNEAVLDPSYRSALGLSPASFCTSLRLEQHGILATIKTLMMPKAAGVLTAELYKLNVYRPGDFFKSHVDTPRGPNMFGSLVICLPQPHTGGQLLVHSTSTAQPTQHHTFDWGPQVSEAEGQWAAFYSDSPHEILPVESGHRITLTYNLSMRPASGSEPPPLPGLSASSTSLHAAIQAALASPDFMPSGGVLGFGCQHAYPHTDSQLFSAVPAMLKGDDAALLAAARALGLHADVQAVYDMKNLADWYPAHNSDNDSDEEGSSGGESDQGVLRLAALQPIVLTETSDEDFTRAQAVRSLFPDSTNAGDITWCRRPSDWALQQVNAPYGNEPVVKEWYSAAVILVSVPASDLRK